MKKHITEEEFNKIFSRNLKEQLTKNEMTQVELAKRLGVGATTVSSWVNALKTPRMDKVDKMCEIFGIKRSDLLENKSEEDKYKNIIIEKYLKLNKTDKEAVNILIEGLSKKQDKQKEVKNEDRIREEWGLSNSEDSIVRERNEASESLGQDETEILERESQLSIDSMEVSRNSFDEVSRGSRESRENVRESDERNEEERGSNRETQSRRSDGVGSQSEQHQEQS